jgi:hypothetical protein
MVCQYQRFVVLVMLVSGAGALRDRGSSADVSWPAYRGDNTRCGSSA